MSRLAWVVGLLAIGCGSKHTPADLTPAADLPNPTGYRADPDMQSLAGEWRVRAITTAGLPVDAEKVAALKLSYRFAGTSMMVNRPGKPMQPWSYALDSRKTPKQIATKLLTDGTTANGLYELDGNTLRLCLNVSGGPAPAKLESTTDSKTDLLTLEKVN